MKILVDEQQANSIKYKTKKDRQKSRVYYLKISFLRFPKYQKSAG